jgi:hypothetical protein
VDFFSLYLEGIIKGVIMIDLAVCRQNLESTKDFYTPKKEKKLLSDRDSLTSEFNRETQPCGKDKIKSTSFPPKPSFQVYVTLS